MLPYIILNWSTFLPLRSRDVSCHSASGDVTSDTECYTAVGMRPVTQQLCDLGSCSPSTWFVADWSNSVRNLDSHDFFWPIVRVLYLRYSCSVPRSVGWEWWRVGYTAVPVQLTTTTSSAAILSATPSTHLSTPNLVRMITTADPTGSEVSFLPIEMFLIFFLYETPQKVGKNTLELSLRYLVNNQ